MVTLGPIRSMSILTKVLFRLLFFSIVECLVIYFFSAGAFNWLVFMAMVLVTLIILFIIFSNDRRISQISIDKERGGISILYSKLFGTAVGFIPIISVAVELKEYDLREQGKIYDLQISKDSELIARINTLIHKVDNMELAEFALRIAEYKTNFQAIKSV
jgi:hypothetical protein